MERKLHLTGKGNLTVTPDLVILTFPVRSLAWEYEAAIQSLNHLVEGLRQIIEAKGISWQDERFKL